MSKRPVQTEFFRAGRMEWGPYTVALEYHIDAQAQEIAELKESLDLYENGFEGGCMCCEPVALKNRELQRQKDQVKRDLEDLRARWERESAQIINRIIRSTK